MYIYIIYKLYIYVAYNTVSPYTHKVTADTQVHSHTHTAAVTHLKTSVAKTSVKGSSASRPARRLLWKS